MISNRDVEPSHSQPEGPNTMTTTTAPQMTAMGEVFAVTVTPDVTSTDGSPVQVGALWYLTGVHAWNVIRPAHGTFELVNQHGMRARLSHLDRITLDNTFNPYNPADPVSCRVIRWSLHDRVCSAAEATGRTFTTRYVAEQGGRLMYVIDGRAMTPGEAAAIVGEPVLDIL